MNKVLLLPNPKHQHLNLAVFSLEDRRWLL